LHWSAVFAGVFVSLLVYVTLMSLGLAFGAGAVHNAFSSDENFQGIAVGAGVWTVATIMISLFFGSYASGRASGIIATRIGYTQGAVITSLFFVAIVSQIGSTVGIFTRNIANISSSAVGSAVSGVASNPRLSAMLEDGLGTLKLKSQTPEVVRGLARRLMWGDTDSARNFLAAQAGLSQADAKARIDTLSANFKTMANDLGQKSSEAASRLGWAAFVTVLLGALSAMLGGGTGAMVNLRKPLDRVDDRAMRRTPVYT
jgi:hypothetical protein